MATGNTLWYKCCEVLSRGNMMTPCWVCGEESPVDYYESYAGANILEMPYRSTSSTVWMNFSTISPEIQKWLHP